jgi:hypothetical protein
MAISLAGGLVRNMALLPFHHLDSGRSLKALLDGVLRPHLLDLVPEPETSHLSTTSRMSPRPSP